MRLAPPPARASWIHHTARQGFEVAFVEPAGAGIRFRGQTTANEASALWSVGYDVVLDDSWRTQTVKAVNLALAGAREVALQRGAGDGWTVNGELRRDLDGCVDVDFESSACTNALPVHRIDFEVGRPIEVAAAFVRADLRVERLEQRYTLMSAGPELLIFAYQSSTFDFECVLRYDSTGFAVDYPGIATRDS